MEENDGNSKAHVQAKFFTKLEKYKIQEAPFSLPTSSGIDELNSLIQSLLFDENSTPEERTSFDFLIQNEFLLASLSEFIDSKNLSTENVIEIEYTIKEELPELNRTIKQNEWISYLDVLEKNDSILAACYDCSISLINGVDGKPLYSLKHHEMPVKAVKWINGFSFVSCSQDQSIIIWNINNEKLLQPAISCKGHTSSVDCIAVSPTAEKIVSGSFDKTIKIWNCQDEGEDERDEVEPKKKKANMKSKISVKTPLITFSSHNDAVSSVTWSMENEFISSSLDHCMKIWDVDANKTKNTITGTKPFLSISYSSLNNQVASGNTDSIVRIWDPRSCIGLVIKGTLSSHKSWVSTVNWSHSNENHLLTGSYDKKLFIWDIRKMSDVLKELGSHTDKILCSYWDKKYLLSGGADCNINFYQ